MKKRTTKTMIKRTKKDDKKNEKRMIKESQEE